MNEKADKQILGKYIFYLYTQRYPVSTHLYEAL